MVGTVAASRCQWWSSWWTRSHPDSELKESWGPWRVPTSGTLPDFDIEVTDFDIRTCLYRSHQTSIPKFCILTSVSDSVLTFSIEVFVFDIEVSDLTKLWYRSLLTSIDFDIKALPQWKLFNLEVLTSISKRVNIEVYFDIEVKWSASLRYRRLLWHWSWKSYTDIEVLCFDIEVSLVSKIFNIKVLLILSGPARAVVLLQGCWQRMQAAAVTEHRLQSMQCRQFIATRFLA